MAIAQCEVCGDPFNKFPVNTKYCYTCRIIRDLQHMPNRKAECISCEVEFWPIRASWRSCPDCSILPSKFDITCSLCGVLSKVAPGMTSTCISCVSSSKKLRLKYLDSLLKRRGEVIKNAR